MSVRLSIIVPMYGVEKYLRKCVDSLLHQDLPMEEYEIVMVDDGSPDKCGEIADEYAEKYANVRVIHQENKGLSGARNSGIKEAKGRYIQVVDSDDYLVGNVLKGLVEQMDEEQLDVLRFNYQFVNEEGIVISPYKRMKAFVDYGEEACDGETFLNERLGYGCYAWQFVMRTEILKETLFEEGILFEDTEWAPRMLLKARKVASTSGMTYNYLMREGSITLCVDKVKIWKGASDKLKVIDSLRRTRDGAKRKDWFKGMESLIVLSIVDYVCRNIPEKRHEAMSRLREREVFPLSHYHLTRKQCCKAMMLSVCPTVYCWLMGKRK